MAETRDAHREGSPWATVAARLLLAPPALGHPTNAPARERLRPARRRRCRGLQRSDALDRRRLALRCRGHRPGFRRQPICPRPSWPPFVRSRPGHGALVRVRAPPSRPTRVADLVGSERAEAPMPSGRSPQVDARRPTPPRAATALPRWRPPPVWDGGEPSHGAALADPSAPFPHLPVTPGRIPRLGPGGGASVTGPPPASEEGRPTRRCSFEAGRVSGSRTPRSLGSCPAVTGAGRPTPSSGPSRDGSAIGQPAAAGSTPRRGSHRPGTLVPKAPPDCLDGQTHYAEIRKAMGWHQGTNRRNCAGKCGGFTIAPERGPMAPVVDHPGPLWAAAASTCALQPGSPKAGCSSGSGPRPLRRLAGRGARSVHRT
jgi:hypothetical protein